VVNTPNGVTQCSADCAITAVVGTNISITYQCDCVNNLYVCTASSSTTVACPADIALEAQTDCAPTVDEFCKLTATTGTTTTTYSCSCSSSAHVWSCTK
jgi:hypothetical protein